MDFSKFCESMEDPIKEEAGKKPTCRDGYVYDKMLKKCIPAANAATTNKAGRDQKAIPDPIEGWNTIGATGLNGDGYAFETDASTPESVEEAVLYHKTDKDERKMQAQERKHREDDNRMRYGKSGKPPSDELRPGEVRRWDKVQQKWVSNKK